MVKKLKERRELLAWEFPIKITRDGKLYEILNEVTGQALTVDAVGIQALRAVLREIET